MPDQPAEPIVGARVTYHGSLTKLHGRTFLLLNDRDSSDGSPRYLLADPETGEELRNVRASSFIPVPGAWWPPTAVDFRIGGYLYKASHTERDATPYCRFVYVHTAYGFLRRTWCHVDEETAELRTLDARGGYPA